MHTISHFHIWFSLLLRTDVEQFSQSMSRASALSFMSSTADFDAVNNFEKNDRIVNENSNLEQARRAIVEARTAMDRILELLESAA